MPVIKVSNETYQELLKRQAQDGNVMSIVMDRLMLHIKEMEDAGRKDTKPKDAERRGKREKAGKRIRKPKTVGQHINEAIDQFDQWFYGGEASHAS